MQGFRSWIGRARWHAGASSLLVAALCGVAGPGGAQGIAESPYAEPVALPACDVSDPEVRIIDGVADWAALDDPAARIFCVRPGRYRSAGTIRLERSGAAGRPRVLRYHDPAVAGVPHPAQLASSERAIIQALEIRGARHWLVDGLTVQGSEQHGVALEDASDNVLNRLLVQDAERALVRFKGASHRNVLQNSVVRRSVVALDEDRSCVTFGNPGVGRVQKANRVVQNEIYDCTDGIQLHLPSDASEGGHFPGLVIAANDIYLSRARYTNCFGQLDRNGPCGCGENGIDVKIGGTGSAPGRVVSIADNRIWGWRQTDRGPKGDGTGRCGGSGSSGDLFEAHRLASHLAIRGNVLFDGPRGLGIGDGVHHVSMEDNVLHGIGRGRQQTGNTVSVRGPDNQVRRNVVVESETWLNLAPGLSERTVARCNLVIDSGPATGQAGSGSRLGYNTYYGAEAGVAAGPKDLVYEDASRATGKPLCFWRRRWTGPEQVCLPRATWTVEPALAESCQAPSTAATPIAPAAPLLLGR